MCPVWVLIARKIPATREVLYSGWEPVIIAMAISSVGGLILDKTVSDPNFAGMAVFTPVINGVGGNLVAVQASRISTYLHMNGLPMGDPNPTPRKCPTPCTSFFDSTCLMGRRNGGAYLERQKLAGELFLHVAIPGRALKLEICLIQEGQKFHIPIEDHADTWRRPDPPSAGEEKKSTSK
ncbi:hypothetical protein ATANTOWER_022029 [Ataeniobius toweri]|uniref:Solute carrier family 41 member n=1 Tax=Ataeniobius toweri TaxID=208326 RepID=A0ABU7BAK5_9TELE|nr:hypothetical protein [Ataeniobius toweri]